LLFVTVLVAAILLDAGLILLWHRARQRRGKPPAPAPEPPPPVAPVPAPPDLRQLPAWAAAHWQEMLAVLALLAILGYVWIVTPRHVAPTLAVGPVEYPPLAGLGRVWLFLTGRILTWILLCPPVSLALVVGLCLAGWWSGRWPQALRAAVLLVVLATALEGELLLLEDIQSLAAILYGVAFAGFIAWLVVCRPVPLEESSRTSPPGWPEWLLVILVLALAAFARFYALSRIPYGIEGDESKWTTEIVSLMLDGQHTLWSEYHYATEPVSFYMQAPFHRIFGPGILSARIAVATYSLLATLIFYWLVRETLGSPVALLATALLAISPVDVSASRLALAEAHVKLWAVLALALLAHGLRVRRAMYSFLAGVAMAVGLLTYDTFVPMVAVAVLWALVALASRRAAPREWVMHLTALSIPALLVAPFVAEYLAGRIPYYNPGRFAWGAAPVSVLADNLRQVVQNFWSQTTGDFLYNRPGPIINGLLVPPLALGLVLALAHVRRPGYALPLLWFVLVFFPVPIYTGSPFVRIFYPAFPAIYVLIALALLLAWREVSTALPISLRPALLALAGLAMVGLILLNLYIYFNQVLDPADRQMRRELTDMVTQAVAANRLVYVPHFTDSRDFVGAVQPLVWLQARRKLPREQIAQHIWMGTYDEFLSAVSREGIYFESLAFVINHSLPERETAFVSPILARLQQCLGARLERDGQWFDLYVADAFDIQAARCAAPRVHLDDPFPSAPRPGQAARLRWWMEDAAGPAQAVLECERLRPGTAVVEAEDMQCGSGWQIERGFVPDFRGRGYLADQMTLGSASITITLPATGTYNLWLRTYRQASDAYPLYLSVDGQTYTYTYAADATLSSWTWVRTASVSLGAGVHAIRMARPIQRPLPGTYPLWVDILLLSDDPAFNPADESEWLPFVERHTDVPLNVSSGFFRYENVPVGTYRCWVTLSDGERLLDWDGQAGARSDVVEFAVRSVEDDGR
jgi:4-amino-4-deoxy-L-arabinose transferase-like glycosyltransferase